LPGTCQCGYNPQGYAFCYQFPGDHDYANSLLLLQKWFASTVSNNCNTNRRQNIVCMTDWADANDLVIYQYFEAKISNWPYLQMNDKCSQNVLEPSYYALQEKYNAIRNTTDPDEHHPTSSAEILFGIALYLSLI